MALIAGLDFGGGAVKACVADIDSGRVLAVAGQSTETLRSAPGRAEFEPGAWWAAARRAMRQAVVEAARPATDYAAVSTTSLRQGYVLVAGDVVLGRGVLNSDRRGASQLERLRGLVGSARLYEITGHWLAPQLTLPKLLEEQAAGSDRWRRADGVLFIHDWALWRLCGERVSEPSLASAGQLLDIRTRTWAGELLDELGLPTALLPRLVEAGTPVGRLRDSELGLPSGIPVLAGGGDTQMAAAGAGGLDDGIASVVAGTTTPVQASSATLPRDPERHPWVSTHLPVDRWAVETNAGYAGMNTEWLARLSGRSVANLADEAGGRPPGAAGITALVASRTWSEEAWNAPSPSALVGFEPGHGLGDVARAFFEAHAYAIRANLEDLERALGSGFAGIRLLGGAGRVRSFGQLLADVLCRPIQQVGSDYPAGRGFAWLAARSLHGSTSLPADDGEIIEPGAGDAYQASYQRFTETDDSLRRAFRGANA